MFSCGNWVADCARFFTTFVTFRVVPRDQRHQWCLCMSIRGIRTVTQPNSIANLRSNMSNAWFNGSVGDFIEDVSSQNTTSICSNFSRSGRYMYIYIIQPTNCWYSLFYIKPSDHSSISIANLHILDTIECHFFIRSNISTIMFSRLGSMEEHSQYQAMLVYSSICSWFWFR